MLDPFYQMPPLRLYSDAVDPFVAIAASPEALGIELRSISICKQIFQSLLLPARVQKRVLL